MLKFTKFEFTKDVIIKILTIVIYVTCIVKNITYNKDIKDDHQTNKIHQMDGVVIMFNNFLRTNKVAMWFLTFIRIYLGYKWITAGWHKLTGGFDAAGFLQGAIAKSTGEAPTVQAWWGTFLEHVALPNVGIFNYLIPLGEFLVGLGLILGTFTTFAALMGLVMNAAFLFSGTVSTNAQMLLLEVLIVVAAANAGKIGLDYYVLPYLRGLFHKKDEIRPVSPTTKHNLKHTA
ncbi:hypothetical protein D3C81_1133760 [compost metagenome]